MDFFLLKQAISFCTSTKKSGIDAWSLDSYDMFREERNRKTIIPLALDYRMNAFSDANYLQKTLTVFLMSVLVGLHRSPPQLIHAVGGKCPSIFEII